MRHQYSSNYSNASSYEDVVSSVSGTKLFVLIIYGVLSLGLIFNCLVISTVVNIFVTLKNNLTNKHTFVYILALSIVDMCVLSNVPLVMLDILMGNWVLGQAMCKVHWTVDSINKTLSTFILTALTFDRFLAICKPHTLVKWRNVKTSLAVLGGCLLFAVLLLYPCYVQSTVVNVHLRKYNITLRKCSIMWSRREARAFIYYIFMLGYAVPLSLMTWFHCRIMWTLWRNERRMRHARKTCAARKVTQRTALLVTFYFLCMTPFWVFQFFIYHTNVSDASTAAIMPIVLMVVHVLVYLNSAVNPLLYALLNMELRRQHNKAQEKHRRDTSNSAAQNMLETNSCQSTTQI